MLTRIISAAILLPLVVGIIGWGGWLFYLAVMLVIGLGVYEFRQLMLRGNFRPSLLFAGLMAGGLLLDAIFPEARAAQPVVALILISSLTWQLNHRGGQPIADWALAIVGGLYLGLAGEHFILLRLLPNGERWLLLTLTGTWLADSGAYFVGSRWGRHKMVSALSPKKSWEGLVGGVIFGMAFNPIVAVVFGLPPLHGAVLGLIGATIGTLGDLSISMIKRQVGAKDSGRLIPGHGGMLDRLDSLLFTVIVGYYYLVWVVQL
jgi:phosphatidate cytidylyltransferase